jgi:hypothetical protein
MRGEPIGWHVKALSACMGLLLILVAFVSASAGEDQTTRLWWLPAVFGGLFLLPLYSTPATAGEGPHLRRRARSVRKLERWVSGMSFAGGFTLQWIYRLLAPGSIPISAHPIFGPLMILFSILFFAGALGQFYVAYLDTKARPA